MFCKILMCALSLFPPKILVELDEGEKIGKGCKNIDKVVEGF